VFHPIHALAARALITAALLLQPAAARALDAAEPFKPEIGQAGKDVIWVPTPQRAVERMLMLAKVGPDDFLIDLGSGDGRIVITAAKRYGAKGFGVDLNPDMVRLSKHRARQAGVADRARFHVRDIFQTDLTQATVVTLYLLPELNLRLRPKLLALAPGTRIVANAFDMGEWEADEFDSETASALRLWIVPARVAGQWRWAQKRNGRTQPVELELNQQFQRISGLASIDKQRLRIRDARLQGARLRFTLLEEQRAGYGVRFDYAGRVVGDTIEGEIRTSENEKPLRWLATRRVRPATGKS
jgi:SAM-dependent methyltransferase